MTLGNLAREKVLGNLVKLRIDVVASLIKLGKNFKILLKLKFEFGASS